MRRCLRVVLVGVLTLSLSFDSARACWYLRRCHGPVIHVSAMPAPGPIACVASFPADAMACWAGMPMMVPQPWIHDPCEGWIVAETAAPFVGAVSDCRCGAEIVFAEFTESLGASTTMVPTPVQESVVEPPVATAIPQARNADPREVRSPQAAPAPESVVAPAAQPEPPVLIPARTDEPVVPKTPTAAGVAPEVPDLKPVAPEDAPSTPSAAVVTPVDDDAPPAPTTEAAPPRDAAEAVVEPVTEPVAPEMKPPETGTQTPPVPPAAEEEEENLFEQRPSVDKPAAAVESATEPPPAPKTPAIPEDGDAPSPSDQPPASEPGGSDAPQPETPTNPAETPATDPATPTTTDEFPSSTSVEPMRRWIDATGAHATIGVLVEVRPDGAVIRKRRGGSVVVPLDRLSGHDRAYAIEAGARLAATRPGNHETAGL